MLKEKDFDRLFPTKKHLHFDRRISFNRVRDYVMDPNKISTHSFLPLVHFNVESQKYTGYDNPNSEGRPIKAKSRKIMYAGHIDGYIYKYYSILLNNVYNYYSKEAGIDECVTAYRDNKKGLSNIDFSAEVIHNVVSYGETFIFLGDFTEFFDRINHNQLKINLQRVSKRTWLSADWYNIYRSLTKFGYYKKECINKKCGTGNKIRSSGKNSYFDSIMDFREYQKENKVCYNKLPYGIPQGTALSGVFANVYCIDFDLQMQEVARAHNGIYRRYSDDFILVIPKTGELDSGKIIKEINKLSDTYNLILHPDKTESLVYNNNKIYNYKYGEESQLDYLGFVFDGIHVRARSKSIYKFYRKSAKLIDRAKRVKRKKKLDKLPYRKRIYGQYTDMGANKKPYGNFITYMKNSQKTFDRKSPNTVNLMMDQLRNRKRKIESLLGYRIHTKVRDR